MGKEGRLRDTMKNLSMEWKIKAQIKSPPEREIGMNDRVLHTSQALVTGKKKKKVCKTRNGRFEEALLLAKRYRENEPQ